MNFSVVIPVYNEEDNILPLAEECAALSRSTTSFEVLFVDDGSRDQTWQRIGEAAKRFPCIRGIRSDQNRGQSAAMLMGLAEAQGDILVTMDGDRQNNPADIPRLVERIGSVDVVCGYRAKRRDTWSRRIGSKIGNAIRNRVTRDGLRDTGCSLKAFKRECRTDLPPINGVHRFMAAYFHLHNRRIEEIPVDHRPRPAGTSKYTNLSRLPRTAFDLLGFVWYRRRYLPCLQVSRKTQT
ncbi:MAG: glycosyltransferase family 2 protein [Kiritimatiellae bacterium]|nr:glycosyltransferase family 2 protein [Kiritimatiellia bacterium]MCO5060687.1 glycosyltransferase family 2 protein [Kiritimatiellia bacterium]MCO5068923.1 glycosyltransferase family 2 protein [Kiritimatiellia bacterium]